MEAPRDESAAPDLIDPVRQRLVAVASEALGRFPIEDVPALLRPIARFAPVKRARLGATSLAAALDADPAFRELVATIVADASPQLADSIRAGEPTTASDPIDVAVVAYLLRPPGWQQAIAAANSRWMREHEQSERGAQDSLVRQLREQLASVKAQARADGLKAKDDLAVAAKEVAAELGVVRKQLRGQAAELNLAVRERDEALAAAGRARAESEEATATRENDARRWRARIEELERALESARRAVRSQRELDDARLWLLVDTIAEAASGIRRELSLPAPSLHPADAVANAQRTDGKQAVRHADDVAALDRLLSLPNAHLIIDGYNVTKSGYGELPLIDQRRRLIGALAGVAGRTGIEITVVFDGGARPPATAPAPRGVRVLFSAADEIADDLIRRLVAAEPPGRVVIVVSSDQEIVVDVRAVGVWAVASSVLLARLER